MHTDYPIAGITLQPNYQWSRPVEYLFNMGGPMSRTRTEPLRSSVLGGGGGPIYCPLVASLGLEFSDFEPVPLLMDLLYSKGYRSPEELRRFSVPYKQRYICHASIEPKKVDVHKSSIEVVFYQAVMLGLCTSTIFDPARPIIWTDASLTRCLDLYDMKGFYG